MVFDMSGLWVRGTTDSRSVSNPGSLTRQPSRCSTTILHVLLTCPLPRLVPPSTLQQSNLLQLSQRLESFWLTHSEQIALGRHHAHLSVHAAGAILQPRRLREVQGPLRRQSSTSDAIARLPASDLVGAPRRSQLVQRMQFLDKSRRPLRLAQGHLPQVLQSLGRQRSHHGRYHH